MNNKMTTHSQLSIIEPKKYKNKNKLSKQLEQEQNHRNGDHKEGHQWRGGMGEKVQRTSSTNGRHKIDGEGKNSIGNGEAKELTRTTHGRGLRWGECWWELGCKVEGNTGEKKMGQL